MNEQALKDSYELFKQKGYTKSFDEYVNLINTNPNALNDSYTLFKEQGYEKSIEEFSTLVGVKKKDESVSTVQEDVTESITPEVQEEVISSDVSPQRTDSIADNDYLVGLSNGSIKTNEGNVATISEVITAAQEQGYSQDEIDSLMVSSSSDPTDSMSVTQSPTQEDKPNWQKQIDEFGESASIWNDPSAAGISTEEIREYYLSTQQPESVPTDSTLTEQEDVVSSDVSQTEKSVPTDSTITTPTADVVEETVVEQAPIPTELDQQIYQGIYGRAIEQGDTSVPSIEEWLTNKGLSAATTEDANKEALEMVSLAAKNVEHAYDESFIGDLIRTIGSSGNPALRQRTLDKKITKIKANTTLTEEEKQEKIDNLSTFDAVWASEPLVNITGYTPEDTNEFAVGVMSTLLDFAATPSEAIGSGIVKVAGKILPSKNLLGIGKKTYDVLVNKLKINPNVARKIIEKA